MCLDKCYCQMEPLRYSYNMLILQSCLKKKQLNILIPDRSSHNKLYGFSHKRHMNYLLSNSTLHSTLKGYHSSWNNNSLQELEMDNYR